MRHKLEIIKTNDGLYDKIILDGKELIGVKSININNSYQENETKEEITITLMDVESVTITTCAD